MEEKGAVVYLVRYSPADSKMAEEKMETEDTDRKAGQPQIFLTMTDNYARSWRTWDGVREFVQNWYDAVLLNLEEISPPLRGRKNLKVVSEVRGRLLLALIPVLAL